MKKEIITIAGTLGSGKSSTAKKVAGILGYKHFSSGDFFRQVGLELGLSVTETNIRAETDPKIDEMTDQKMRDLNKTEKIVVDSRLAFHWIPNSFKVYLDLPPEIAKNRILNNLKENKLRQQSEKESSNLEEIYATMQKRLESEQKRYWDLYKIDNTDKNNLEQVVNIIVTEYKKWRETN